ncbi:MAG: hypothetical protein IT336_00460 [Thermomicrobiales bacterium]|nr:hypothetical protein [Thermomicrobiales bacterium]
MSRYRSLPIALIVAALMVVAGLTLGGRSIVAQDMASPPAGGEAHPAHIHLGTCAELGEVVFPLTDVSAGDASATPMAGGMDVSEMDEMVASPTVDEDEPEAIAWSETEVQAGLDEIIAGGHAINVHESMDNIQNYIACGEITGTPADGELEIELGELNDSGYEGSATLTDNGDGTTTVSIELYEAHDEMGTPVPTS